MDIANLSYQNKIYHNTHVSKSNVNFCGQAGIEKLGKDIYVGTRNFLIQETAFFREPEVLEFVKGYIATTLKHKPEINIIDGACSKGYETYTLAMMLDKASQKINITGFDLGEEAIKEANNRKFVIKKLIINSERDEYYKMGYAAFNDDYLAFAPKETLQGKEAEYQTMFNDFFEEIPNDKEKHSLSECIKSIIFKGLIPQFETKCFRPKPAVTDKCRFVQGDILKLNEIVPPHNADVLLFRNALYHLTTKEGGSGFKISLPQEYVNMVVKKVVEQVDNSLNKNGLFVIGQHHSDHTSPVKDILYKELTKRNFIPAFTNQYDSIVTVWEKN